jgi:FAD/FMN-containing dehydrogenase
MMPGPGGGAGPLVTLQALLGPDVVTAVRDDEVERYLVDHRRLYRGRALSIARPRNTEQVSRLLAYCHAQRIGVVPQGGNTSYCGGATPDASGTQLLLSLERMDRIRNLDADDFALIAEAGCVLSRLQDAALAADRLLPLSLGSEGSCQLGGVLSTNAGGTNVLRYGMARDLVLGLEVVLADGRVLNALSTLRKDNTGYDVKSLFLGAEGTLGVITAASLRLFPREASLATAFVAVPDIAAAVTLLARLRAASGDRLSSFELIPRAALDLLLTHLPDARDPLGEPSPWYVLCEVGSARADEDLAGLLAQALESALAAGLVTDAALARGARDRQTLWSLRHRIPEVQRRHGPSLKHDLSLPVSRVARFVAEAESWLREAAPEGQLVAYGHLGDGNLHFNVSARTAAETAALAARAEVIRRHVHDLVRAHGGSFSAEHGIGVLKVDELARYAPAVELELMRAIKRTLDPHGIMNPGKVLRP